MQDFCVRCPSVMSFYQVEPVPSILLPCSSCNRTFRPEALAKHAKVCEKTLMKKRKKFDSAKQRLQGTEVNVLTSTPGKGVRKDSTKTMTQSKWREKQADLARTLQAVRKKSEPTVKVKPSDYEQCPYCERYFGPKAFDRHTDWCKEQQIKIKPNSNVFNEARERLQVRTKYRAPLTNKVLTRDKYLPRSRDPSPMSVPKTLDESPKSKMSNPLDRTSSLRISGRSKTHVVRNPLTSPKLLNETKISSSSLSDNKYDTSASREKAPKIYPEATPKKKMLVPPRVVERNRRFNKAGFKLNDTQVNHDIKELFVSSCVIHDPAEKVDKSEGSEYFKSGYVSSDSNLSGSARQSPPSRYMDSFLGRKFKRKFPFDDNITAHEIKNFVDKTIAKIDENAPTTNVISQKSYTILSSVSRPSIEIKEEPKSLIAYTLSNWKKRIFDIAARQFMEFLKWKSNQKAILYEETEEEEEVEEEEIPNDLLFQSINALLNRDVKIIELSDDYTSSSSCSCDSCKRNKSFAVQISKITEVKDVSTSMENLILTSQNTQTEVEKVETSSQVEPDLRSNISSHSIMTSKSLFDSNFSENTVQEKHENLEFWNVAFIDQQSLSPSISEDSINLENQENSINLLHNLQNPKRDICIQTDESSFKDYKELKYEDTKLITWAYLANLARNMQRSESTQSVDRDSLDFENIYYMDDIKEKNSKNDDFINKILQEENVEYNEDYTSSEWDCSSSNWHEERDNFTVHRKKVKYYETIEYKQELDDYKTVKTSVYELPPLKLTPTLKDLRKLTPVRYPSNSDLNWPNRVQEKNTKRKPVCLNSIRLPPIKKPSSSSCLTRAAGEGDTLKSEGSRFCHECGAKYPVPMAKFCCNCGIRRISL